MDRYPDSETKHPERLLCSRRKNVEVFLLTRSKQFRAEAEMQDEVHHLRVEVVVDIASMKIKTIRSEMFQVPDEECRRGGSYLDPLIGKRVAPGMVRELGNGAGRGCTHLVNLFHEACYNLTLAQSVHGKTELEASFPGITEEQIYKIFFWFRPELQNSCIRYAEDGPFWQRVCHAELPAKAEKLKALAEAQNKSRSAAATR